MAKGAMLGKTPWLIVLVLTFVTAGVYIPIWFIRARPTLARLNTTTRLAPYLPYGLLILYAVTIAAVMVSEMTASSRGEWPKQLDAVISMLFVVLAVFLALRVVDILHEYSHGRLTSNLTVSRTRAILLSITYLQYEMNRLPAPVDGKFPDGD